MAIFRQRGKAFGIPSHNPRSLSAVRNVRLQAGAHGGVIPLSSKVVVTLGVLFSLCFILTVSCAFIGADISEPHLRKMLDAIAVDSPGLMLYGESVDVDVDEPSITIRWSLIACGSEFLMNGSSGVHGSQSCGLPSSPLQIFLDGADQPVATYDPALIPFINQGQRRNIQALVEFETDHVLDIHEARLYPFDTYVLSGSLRAVNTSTNSSTAIAIRRVTTLGETSSFSITTGDQDSYTLSSNQSDSTTGPPERIPSRDFDLHVARPSSARAVILLLFGMGWALTHLAVVTYFLAKGSTGIPSVRMYLVCSTGALFVLPKLREAMPDAPGYDGVLIDCIGFFGQMIITGLAVIALIVLLLTREFQSRGSAASDESNWDSDSESDASLTAVHSDIESPPPSPSRSSSAWSETLPGTPKLHLYRTPLPISNQFNSNSKFLSPPLSPVVESFFHEAMEPTEEATRSVSFWSRITSLALPSYFRSVAAEPAPSKLRPLHLGRHAARTTSVDLNSSVGLERRHGPAEYDLHGFGTDYRDRHHGWGMHRSSPSAGVD